MSRKRPGRLRRFFRRIGEVIFGKPESLQKIQTMTGKQFKTQEKLIDYFEEAFTDKPEEIPVQEIPTTEQLMPGGFPQIQQPQFRELPDIDIDAMKAAAERKFQTQDVPALAERFSSMGKGALTSPGFAATLGRARADLTGNLSALGEQMKSQYNLDRGGLETQQQNIGLQGQLGAAATQFQGGQFRMNQAIQSLQRSDLLSQIQQRQRPDLRALGGFAMQPSFQPVIRPATQGLYGQAGDVAKMLAKAYVGGM